MEHSSKWNTPIIIKNGTLIKMEHSYYQNGTLLLSKWNTHQNGTLLLLSKMEQSSKWNTPIIIKREHSSKWNTQSTWEGAPSFHTLHSMCPLWFCTIRSWFRMELSSSASHGLSNGTLLISKPWIIAKSLGSSFNDLLKTIKTIFNHITVSFSLTQGSPPPPDLDFGLCARVSQRFSFPLSPRSNFPPGQRFPRDFRLPEPTIPFYHWSAVSP